MENSTVFKVKAEPRELGFSFPSLVNFAGDALQFVRGGTAVKLEANDSRRLVDGSGSSRSGHSLEFQRPKHEPEDVVMNDNTRDETPQQSRPKFFTIHEDTSTFTYTPEDALKEGLGMVKTIKQTLTRLELSSKLRAEVWDRELTNLEGQDSPRTLIAVCGATGAGKSSLLNAVLDDNIVPTSGMRACTAVVTELAYHKKNTIDADISFLSELEWRQELGVLLQDLVDEDGHIKRTIDLKSDAGVAWQKVHAVYPTISQEKLVKMTVNQIIDLDEKISGILGKTKNIVAKDSKVFAKEIGKYIDSKDQKRGSKKDKDKEPSLNDKVRNVAGLPSRNLATGTSKKTSKSRKRGSKKDKEKEPSLMDKVRNLAGLSSRNLATGTSKKTSKTSDPDAPALWPLIRQVNVRCHAEALSTGAVLVDLPGVADANAARNNIAKDYMKKCNCVWILAPITRAVDDKTARDLLGDAFKMQLMMDGNYDDHAITFVASKCDDISCSEVIRALRLEDDPQLEDIEDHLRHMRKEAAECKKRKSVAESLVKEIEEQLEDTREQIHEHRRHLEALENGQTYTPILKKNKSLVNKKRKITGKSKQGPPKRRRSVASDADEEDELIESDEDSSDYGSDSVESDEDLDEDLDEDDEDENTKSCSEDSDSSESEDEAVVELMEDNLREKIREAEDAIKTGREMLSNARAAKKEAIDALSSVEKGQVKKQREKNAFCSLKRSEFSRDVLKEDFRMGLKDLDDAAAEERDPANFNPTSHLRDYDSIDLPVFTCSSRDYVRLQKQVKGDGKPTCFSNIADTGIPDLQKWCHQLTIASRERTARAFMTHLKAFTMSINSYVQGIGNVTARDREALRTKWESQGFAQPDPYDANPLEDPLDAILSGLGGNFGAGLYSMNKPAPKVDPYGQPTGITPRLFMEFAKLVDKCIQELQQNFKDGLEDKCRVGAANAADAALPTLDEFTGSMHWGTYRATLRRHGSWRRDLNVELVNPFTRNIAHSWSKIFESDLFASFRTSTVDVINTLIKEVEDTAASGLKDRAKLQGEACIEEALVALTNAVGLVKDTMNREQKEISRIMAPHVQAQLVDGYDMAMEERGRGSVARQKACFHGYIANCKDDIFDDGADVVLERLTKAAESIGETLNGAMGKLAQKIEVSLAVLWEGASDNPAQLKARKEIIELVQTVQKQIQLWTQAEQMKQDITRLAATDTVDMEEN